MKKPETVDEHQLSYEYLVDENLSSQRKCRGKVTVGQRFTFVGREDTDPEQAYILMQVTNPYKKKRCKKYRKLGFNHYSSK